MQVRGGDRTKIEPHILKGARWRHEIVIMKRCLGVEFGKMLYCNIHRTDGLSNGTVCKPCSEPYIIQPL